MVRKGEIACNKQFLLSSQCFLPYITLIFHFQCTLKCCLQFLSIWTSLKFFRLVMGLVKFSVTALVFLAKISKVRLGRSVASIFDW